MIIKVSTASNRLPFFVSGTPSPAGLTSAEDKKKQAAALVYAIINNLPGGTIKLMIDHLKEFEQKVINDSPEDKTGSALLYKRELRALAGDMIANETKEEKANDIPW